MDLRSPSPYMQIEILCRGTHSGTDIMYPNRGERALFRQSHFTWLNTGIA